MRKNTGDSRSAGCTGEARVEDVLDDPKDERGREEEVKSSLKGPVFCSVGFEKEGGA